MREFFTGWRRKVGVMTLMMALVFEVGWVRSLNIIDIAHFQPQESRYCILSKDGELSCRYFSPFSEVPEQGFKSIRWTSAELTTNRRRNYKTNWDDKDVKWHWHWGSFDFGSASYEMLPISPYPIWFRREDVWQIPYWSIVVPLTLFSAFLLLTKANSSTRKKNAEPIPEMPV